MSGLSKSTLSFKVVKNVQTEQGKAREEVASFDNAVRAEEYARTLTNMEGAKVGVKIWFSVEEPRGLAERRQAIEDRARSLSSDIGKIAHSIDDNQYTTIVGCCKRIMRQY